MNEKDKKAQDALIAMASTDRRALAEMIVEYVQPNALTLDFAKMILNTREMKIGDQLYVRLRKGIEVRTLVPGSIHLASEVTVEDRAWYQLSGVDVKVLANEWDLESGQIGTISDIQAEMRAKLISYYAAQIFTSLTSLWTAAITPDNFVDVGGVITAAALEDGIDEINYRVGSVRAVVGTRKALTPITKFAQYTPYGDGTVWGVPVNSAIEEVRRTGFVGTYYGCNIIGLDQTFDNPVDNNPQLPEDKVLIIGSNVGEFITYGPVKTKEYTDPRPTPPMWITELYARFGMIIWKQEGIYVVGGLS